ncbi:MAG: LemA protein [Halieaceae bacterium]|jgi:LemA protein
MHTRHIYSSAIALFVIACLSGCGINTIPTLDEKVKSNWAQVENQYQRRADLIPNLVSTVKGYAAHEKSTLTAVTEARAKVGTIQLGKNLLDNPEAMAQFDSAQGELSSALRRLMVVSERYPDLKANQNFLALQSQLEGTENRISVARRDFIGAVERYNTEIRTFPGRLWKMIMYSDMEVRENFTATSPGAEQAPAVNF